MDACFIFINTFTLFGGLQRLLSCRSAGRYEVDGYVYSADEEPKILMTGKWNESMSYQPCDVEGEPLPGTELKEVNFRCLVVSSLTRLRFHSHVFVLFGMLNIPSCCIVECCFSFFLLEQLHVFLLTKGKAA